MLTIYDVVDCALMKRETGATINDNTVWIDLFRPSRDEDQFVEKALGVSIPTREEMQEIEASSQLYAENAAQFMTAVVLHQKTASGAERLAEGILSTPVTFVLAANRLVTVRYEEPRAFSMFVQRAQKKDAACMNGAQVLVGLLEAIVDREADRVEHIAHEVDKIGHIIFDNKGGQLSRSRRNDIAIKTIGREGDMTSRSRDCLLSLDRLLTYLAHVLTERSDDKAVRARTKTISRDVSSLITHVNSISYKNQFLLDATLGMISIEQNNIIKLFSVASVALMPPTLIASIYGMNFKHMPELEWQWGYPMAVALMIISAILPFVYFKRKGWF